MESKEGAGLSEEETFLLSDVIDHTLCIYDRQGRLRSVDCQTGSALLLHTMKTGLKGSQHLLGNVLEVQCRGGRILQITDEIGRRTQYRYEGDYLVDVVHTDEGITHYEYDENGRITAVTDQNGSRYLENEYDIKGRITKQRFRKASARPLHMTMRTEGTASITVRPEKLRFMSTIKSCLRNEPSLRTERVQLTNTQTRISEPKRPAVPEQKSSGNTTLTGA